LTGVAVLALGVLLTAAFRHQQRSEIANFPAAANPKQITLPSGWRVTPAGKSIPLPGDLPVKMLLTADGKTLVVENAGFHDHSVSLIDTDSGSVRQSINLVKTWAGLALDAEGDDIYVAGGGTPSNDFKNEAKQNGATPEQIALLDSPVYRLPLKESVLGTPVGMNLAGIPMQDRYTAGIAAAKDGSLYIININTDTVYRLSGKPHTVTASATVGYRPFAVQISPDGKQVAVSNWGDQSISLLDPITLKEEKRIAVGQHPCELLYAPDGRLFVANSGSDTISVLKDGRAIETIRTSLNAHDPIGSTPVSLALTADAKRLFVANAGNNAVAMVDTEKAGQSRVLGFIPTGWYPSSVAVTPDGKSLFIGTGKGIAFRGNFPPQRPMPAVSDDNKTKYDYIGDVLSGAVNVVSVPSSETLADYTRQVRANVPSSPDTVASSSQIMEIEKNAFRKIKHVLYIIRENRTYDQVFGDVTGTNADPNITMYGETYTPNSHALARSTVLLDNLYCSGEVSEDGHQWCNAAYATDFTEKAWTNSYSDRGEPDADDRLKASPAGYLWDACARHGLTYRSYGEFASFHSSPKTEPIFQGESTLKGHASEDWSLQDGENRRDFQRVNVFLKDLQEADRTGNWPNFVVMSLGEDHTHGLSPGENTPFACVASNDVALGKIVEACSHSRFWKEMAIFVIEDDAQDGPDHVDAHRTVGLVLSPYVKRGVVDSTLYTTAGMVRTMERILNLPPMTQNDALAMPLYNCFTTTPNLTPFASLPARTDLAARNPAPPNGTKTVDLDFSAYDRADPAILNAQLWDNAHPGKPMPAPVHSGILSR
jgi:YVTN family beta-propeller protein